MGFKTLTIKEDVYNELIVAKGKDESFSEFFHKLVDEKRKKPDISRFYGAWSDMSESEFEKVTKRMKAFRKSADDNFKERVKRLFDESP